MSFSLPGAALSTTIAQQAESSQFLRCVSFRVGNGAPALAHGVRAEQVKAKEVSGQG